jgi:ribosomal protein S18 acetylase RimI-like enzyme/predicted nucleotidyltransferase
MREQPQQLERILDLIAKWVRARQDIRGLALVGSHASGTARTDSDIDLVVLATAPAVLRADTSWLEAIDWSSARVRIANWDDEDYGIAWSRRVRLNSGAELEISFAPVAWAFTDPVDAGTRRVVSDGCRILHDPDGLLAHLCRAVKGSIGAALRPTLVLDGRGAVCREVIESLPDWFGIPASNEAFVAAAEELPMLACFAPSGEVVGFVSVKSHTAVAAELYVLGVKRAWHRRGIGRSLIEAAAQLAASRGARFLTVKTLAPSNLDPNYAATRRFYEAVGLLPIEEFPTLWNADNPCLLMLRPLVSCA